MKVALSRLCRWIDTANLAGAWFAAGCVAVLAVILFVEIIATSGFAWSQPWAVEYTAYLCAIVLLGGAGYTLRHSGHIRVAVALECLPTRLVRVLAFFCTVGATVVTGILAYGLFELALRSMERGSGAYFSMQSPLVDPQGALAVATILLLLALIARAIRCLIGEPPDIAEERAAGEGAVE